MPDKTLYLYFDESGNLGSGGRYFNIACILTENPKSLSNRMKRSSLQVKKKLGLDLKTELKASELYSNQNRKEQYLKIIKDIFSKDIMVYYMVVDKEKITNPTLMKSPDAKNAFYNFIIKLLVKKVLKNNDQISNVKLILDNRTIKVGERLGLEKYLFKELVLAKLEKSGNAPSISFDVYYQSSEFSYLIQAVDFVSNAIYKKYTKSCDEPYNLFDPKKIDSNLFPRETFGK